MLWIKYKKTNLQTHLGKPKQFYIKSIWQFYIKNIGQFYIKIWQFHIKISASLNQNWEQFNIKIKSKKSSITKVTRCRSCSGAVFYRGEGISGLVCQPCVVVLPPHLTSPCWTCTPAHVHFTLMSVSAVPLHAEEKKPRSTWLFLVAHTVTNHSHFISHQLPVQGLILGDSSVHTA